MRGWLPLTPQWPKNFYVVGKSQTGEEGFANHVARVTIFIPTHNVDQSYKNFMTQYD